MERVEMESCRRLLAWCLAGEFQGWDVFDGLNSRVFQATPLVRSRLCRLAWIQFFKRCPVNLRGLALVPKGCNAKGLALFASALLRLGRTADAEAMLLRLKDMRCGGYAGSGWGYDFDWQARAFFVPRGTPNMVATVFAAQAFLDMFRKTANERWLAPAREACTFLLEHLMLKPEDCFGYIPGEQARVHNVNMLGAALLAKVCAVTGEDELVRASTEAMAWSVNAQREDFSWPYGLLDHHQFVDNFHTGYNLVALKEWMDATGNREWTGHLVGGYRFYLDAFWLENGGPKYYANTLYPMDIHCSAQGIVTCRKLAKLDPRSLDMARRIAQWAIANMQDKRGFFYYQKTRWYTNRIPYIRWSQAWMLYALSME